MEKKNYLAPAANEVSILTMQMMATSEQNIRIERDSKGDQQLTNEHRGDWGDLWN